MTVRSNSRSLRRSTKLQVAPLMPSPELPLLEFPTASTFEAWLAGQPNGVAGAWIKFARGNRRASALCKSDAVDCALAHGWIDGQLGRMTLLQGPIHSSQGGQFVVSAQSRARGTTDCRRTYDSAGIRRSRASEVRWTIGRRLSAARRRLAGGRPAGRARCATRRTKGLRRSQFRQPVLGAVSRSPGQGLGTPGGEDRRDRREAHVGTSVSPFAEAAPSVEVVMQAVPITPAFELGCRQGSAARFPLRSAAVNSPAHLCGRCGGSGWTREDNHVHRNRVEVQFSARCLEQGSSRRPGATSEAQRDVGHSSSASDEALEARPGVV